MKKVIILLGPTGVGKTEASLLLAKALNTEIAGSDSMQIYKQMDIGTAKPPSNEREVIRHHMIDVVDPWEFYSVGEYIAGVQPILNGLLKNGKIPIIVGGTGLYIKAMTKGIFKGPSADWDMRNDLAQKEALRPGFLFDYLKSLDLDAASKIMPADKRRTIRALEVCLKSDKTISLLHKSSTHPLPYDYIKIGIKRERKELYEMIEQRVDKMMDRGLVDEVKKVVRSIKRYGASGQIESYPSMQAIGYKEMIPYLSKKISLEEAVRLIKRRTRMYAKRQFTWFKKEEGVQWIDVSGIYRPDDIFQKVAQWLAPLKLNLATLT